MIETGVTITVYADEDYRYIIGSAPDKLELLYAEDSGNHSSVTFGSIEEMEAVAQAMLKAVKLAKNG